MPYTPIEPPRPIEGAARQVWDRLAARIYADGRLDSVDLEMLARYAETAELYDELLADVRRNGTMVRGRTADQLVRNPALIGLAQCRDALNRMALAIPLVDRALTTGRIDVEQFLASLDLSEIGGDDDV